MASDIPRDMSYLLNDDEEGEGEEPVVLEKKPSASALKKKRRKSLLTVNLTNCKYDSVRRVAKAFGARFVGEGDDWNVYWTDMALPDKLSELKTYQKVNHFPGMNEICRKDMLARNMNRMLKLFPKEYNCFPRTWTLPADFGDFQAYCQSKKNKVFIAKPGSGCQGKGIFLFRNLKDIKSDDHIVCQQYISKPFTIDGFKFDLRLYVLITSCDPLKVYLYHDGLVRLATMKYKEPTGHNMDEFCMHLTNYAINKHSKDFVRDDESGSKRKITTMNKWLLDRGYDLKKIWNDIDDVIIKTIIAAHPIIHHNYRSTFPNHTRGSACFEILGFDILLDRKLKPWLMEVNRSPSFHTDSPLDKEVKEGLLRDTFNLIDLFANDRRRCMEEEKKRVRERLLNKQRFKEASLQQEQEARASYEAHFEKYEESHIGGFRKIYPINGNEEKYDKYFNQSTSLCAQTVASKARADLAKQLRQDLEQKQKELEKYTTKKSDYQKPKLDGSESPPGERRASARFRERSVSIRRRAMSFRVASPTKDEKSTELSVNSPQQICEEEELERMAGLHVRDTLVRGMGMQEQLRALLDSCPSSRLQTPMPCQTQYSEDRNTFFTQSYLQDTTTALSHPNTTTSHPDAYPDTTTISHPDTTTISHPNNATTSHLAITNTSSPTLDHSTISQPLLYGNRQAYTGSRAYCPAIHHMPGYQFNPRRLSGSKTHRYNNSSPHHHQSTPNYVTWRQSVQPSTCTPALSFELYGYAIPPAPPKGGGRRVSYAKETRTNKRLQHTLSVQGLSVSDQLRVRPNPKACPHYNGHTM